MVCALSQERLGAVPVGETSSGESPPQVPAGTVVYAVGDIHGCKDLLELMLDLIRKDREERANSAEVDRCVVVYIGDYIDRGPDSKGVIDLLLSDPLEDVETVFLGGNHEWMIGKMLDDLESWDIADRWDGNGGYATVISYGVEQFSELGKAIPDAHLDFLKGLRLHHTEGDYLFVHAGIRPGVPLDQQTHKDLVWIRREFLEHEGSHGLFVVHGHTPVEEVEVRPNRICIDTHAYETGALTALVLEGTERRFLQTPRDGKSRADWY